MHIVYNFTSFLISCLSIFLFSCLCKPSLSSLLFELMEILSLFALLAFLVLVLISVTWWTPRLFMRSLRDKHVFITGGSSGIGLAIARKALLEGAVVTLVSRSTTNLTKAAERLGKEVECNPDRIRCEVVDVGDYDALSTAIKMSFRWRPIDVLVCNAGLTRGGYLETASIQDLELTVRTNLMGTVNALHAALPSLKEHCLDHPVSIVIMASVASLYTLYGHSVYSATKYAVRGLAEGLRFELLPYNIRVSLICPGFTNTPFLDDADKDQEINELMKTVNLYDRKQAESPDSVAGHTMKAIKRGTFLVTTDLSGFVVATLGRGFVPAGSLGRSVLETVFFFPFRVAAAICMRRFRSAIFRRRKKCLQENGSSRG